MNLQEVQNKQLGQIEQLAKDLLEVLVKSKLGDEPICVELRALAAEAVTERQTRFDEADKQYRGY